MHRFNKFLLAACLSALLLVPRLFPGTSLGVYQQANGDPTQQSKMFREAYETSLSTTLLGLRSTTFTDGKKKSPERIQRDREKADRIDQMAPHLTEQQRSALTSMIGEYATAQPTTELEAVITSFLLTEAQTPSERYERAYKDLMAEMATWDSAINEARVGLAVEKLSLDDRRRQLDAPNGSTEVSPASIQASMKSFSTTPIIKQWLARVLSPTDSAGHQKSPNEIAVDKQRATIVLNIGKDYDTDEVARRIYASMKSGSATDVQMIFSGYIDDELKRREGATQGAPQPAANAAPAAQPSDDDPIGPGGFITPPNSSPPMVTPNPDGTFTIQKEPPNGSSQDAKATNGLVIPPQVVVPLVPTPEKK